MNMMKINFVPLFLLLTLLKPAPANAQSVEQMQQLFPDKLAIFSNINRSVEISYKDGVPIGEANEVSEMMILSDNANGMFNKDKVYNSDIIPQILQQEDHSHGTSRYHFIRRHRRHHEPTV